MSVTVRPDPSTRAKRSRPAATIGYAAELVTTSDGLALRCERKCWRRTCDHDGTILNTTVEPRSLWMVADAGQQLLIQPRDPNVDGIGHYTVTHVVNDWTTLRITHFASDVTPVGNVVVFKLKRKA